MFSFLQNIQNFRSVKIIEDGAGWVLSEEAKQIAGIIQKLGYKVEAPHEDASARSSLFYFCQFTGIMKPKWGKKDRVAVPYYHGMPGTEGAPEFDRCFESFLKIKDDISRVQVTHEEIRTLILNTGIEKEKVYKIVIGIDTEKFKPQDSSLKKKIREELQIPSDAFVVGSFQKDGNGWGEGLEPKLIKGPDYYVEAMGLLKKEIPHLWVLLTGPARGYVKQGLERRGIPFRHQLLDSYDKVPLMYEALDAYLVSARQEGGPKSILESMSKGVPIVSTRVGQASELIEHGKNGWLCNVGDVEEMSHGLQQVYQNEILRKEMISRGFITADENSYQSQIPLWGKFLEGFVRKPFSVF
jgi:glycosyltransferase involved in cell wall biosynthesis